jgi:hypothetical protein
MHPAARRLTTLLGILALVFVFELATASRAHAAACVYWVRQLTDLSLRGDAWQWWDAAAGRYDRGQAPTMGSVLVFRKARGLSRGHVSTVSRVIDRRTIEVDHSWLADNRLYRGMRVVDVSARNDWTEVRVWHPRLNDLGSTVYPTFGFVQPDRPRPDLLFASIREAAPSAGERRSVAVEVSESGERSGRRPIGPATRPGRSIEVAAVSAGDEVRPSIRGMVVPGAPRRDAAPQAQIIQASLTVPASRPTRKPDPSGIAAAMSTPPAQSTLLAQSAPPALAVTPARNPVRVADVEAAAIRAQIELAEAIAALRAIAVDTARIDFVWTASAHDERSRLN